MFQLIHCLHLNALKECPVVREAGVPDIFTTCSMNNMFVILTRHSACFFFGAATYLRGSGDSTGRRLKVSEVREAYDLRWLIPLLSFLGSTLLSSIGLEHPAGVM